MITKSPPRKRSKCEVKKIPGQTLDLCRDIAAANSLGVSYGVYMGMKQASLEHAAKRSREAAAS